MIPYWKWYTKASNGKIESSKVVVRMILNDKENLYIAVISMMSQSWEVSKSDRNKTRIITW